jgi:TolB-like protein
MTTFKEDIQRVRESVLAMFMNAAGSNDSLCEGITDDFIETLTRIKNFYFGDETISVVEFDGIANILKDHSVSTSLKSEDEV